MMPRPNDTSAQPVDRKAALAAMRKVETPAEARARTARGEPPPAHYTPTPAADTTATGPGLDLQTYGEGGDPTRAAWPARATRAD